MTRYELLDLADGRQLLTHGNNPVSILPTFIADGNNGLTTTRPAQRKFVPVSKYRNRIAKTSWARAKQLWGRGMSASRIIKTLGLDVTPAAVYFQASRNDWTR